MPDSPLRKAGLYFGLIDDPALDAGSRSRLVVWFEFAGAFLLGGALAGVVGVHGVLGLLIDVVLIGAALAVIELGVRAVLDRRAES